MEKLFMSAGIVVAIVLCLVGLIKLPFKSFKEKYPKWYKAIFTAVSMALVIVLSILNQIYILNAELWSFNFLTLLSAVFAGVFSGYGGVYEGLGVKQLVKKIIENLKKARDIAESKKAVKFLNKLLENEVIDIEIINLIQDKANQDNKDGEV